MPKEVLGMRFHDAFAPRWVRSRVVFRVPTEHDVLPELSSSLNNANSAVVIAVNDLGDGGFSLRGHKPPNVQVTGAARLYRAASSDRRERG